MKNSKVCVSVLSSEWGIWHSSMRSFSMRCSSVQMLENCVFSMNGKNAMLETLMWNENELRNAWQALRHWNASVELRSLQVQKLERELLSSSMNEKMGYVLRVQRLDNCVLSIFTFSSEWGTWHLFYLQKRFFEIFPSREWSPNTGNLPLPP